MTSLSRAVFCVLILGSLTSIARCGDEKLTSIDGWGNVIDPDGDCTITEEDGKVTITVPHTLHNLNPTIGSNSPRVMQEIEGDFTATVNVTGDFKPGSNATKPMGFPLNGAGLLIWQDEKTCIRLERNRWWIPDEHKYGCFTPLFQYFKDGADQGSDTPGTMEPFFKGRSTYLRLERKADKVTASYSHDGQGWTEVKEIAVELTAKVWVGVAAVNSSDQPFTVEFEELTVMTPDAK